MKTIAYSSPFVPPEWIAAHGFRPHLLRPRAAETLARGVCPYAGSLTEAAVAGLDAAGLVLTTVCDQMRYAAALLETRGRCPVFLLNVPSTWQTPAAAQLYLDELRRLGRFLAGLGGKTPSREDIAREMLTYDCERRARRNGRVQTTGGGAAEGLAPGASAIPLAILGGPLMDSDAGLFDLLHQMGARVVLDATEGGERTLPRPFDHAKMAGDPLAELADAYFGTIVDVFRRPNSRLYQWLGRELAAEQVRGIIFRRYVWCDLWHAELQRLKQWSPVPVLEIDVGPDDMSAPNRVQGRIEAFLETLK